jgi:hypothetical protein
MKENQEEVLEKILLEKFLRETNEHSLCATNFLTFSLTAHNLAKP